MVILLPLAYISLLLVVANTRFGTDWRQAALRAAMLWMAYLVLLTEILSRFTALTFWALSIAWLIPVVAAGIFLWQRQKSGGRILLPHLSRPEGWLDWILLGGIAFYLVLTALVAFLAPPNTFDSLNYHMARVAHWVQDQSLRPFITGLDIQNTNTPGAEIAVLNTFILAGGDRWSNFISWAAYAGSAIAAAWIAGTLSAPKPGQRLAAVFALTLPMSIAQSTSTMNDGVAAFWLICVAAEIMAFGKEGEPVALLFAGLAAGEAFLTKTTCASYLLPMGIWLACLAFRHLKVKQVFLYGFASLLLALAVNAGFISRNLNTYGSLVDPTMTSLHSSELRNFQGVTSNVLRTVGQQLGTPFAKINAGEYLVIAGIHRWMGMDINDPRITSIGKFRISSPNFNEIRVINPLHMLLILLACLIMFIRFRRVEKAAWVYSLVIFSGLVIYCYLFKWQIFGSRLNLSFFVLLSPIVGYDVSIASPRPIVPQITSLLLIVLSLPWLFRIENRPLIDNPAGIPFAGKSLLDTSRHAWYFVTGGDPSAINAIATAIEEAGCHQVGLVISGSSPEYLYWLALHAPRPNMRIEWITTSAVSQKLEDPSFTPCAVICESCGKDDHFNHLTKVLDNGNQQLFLQP